MLLKLTNLCFIEAGSGRLTAKLENYFKEETVERESSKDLVKKEKIASVLEDAKLANEAAQGDKESFKLLVEKYQSKMLFHALSVIKRKEDAEDIVQEAFVKAYFALHTFRGDSPFYSWLKRIVINLAIDYRRKNARRGGVHEELDERTQEDFSEKFNPAKALFRNEDSKKIQSVMQELSSDHREVVILREVDGLSYEEIAETTGATLGTVMSRLHYARKKLQTALSDFYYGVDTNKESMHLKEIKEENVVQLNQRSYSSLKGNKTW